MFKPLFIFSSLLILCLALDAKEIALTFDDAPRGLTPLLKNKNINRGELLLKNLKKAEAPQVTFFVNTERFQGEGLKRIQNYIDAGNFIANHTYDHPDVNKVSVEDYTNSIDKTHQTIKGMKNFTPYFRFPYLREGNTPEKLKTIRDKLAELKINNGYVTINTYDWEIDSQVQKAVKKGLKVNLEKLKKAYIEIIMADVEYYDKMAVDILGRSPKHVLLLHENDIAALFITDLVQELKKRDWKLITAQEAYTDEIAKYKSPNTYKYNPGRVAEIARDKNLWSDKWWSPTCDEDEITKRLAEQKVFEKK